jgi:hypothetical protein
VIWTLCFALMLALILCQPGQGPSQAGPPRASDATSRLSGPQPFLVIPCKFADIDYEPQPPSYYRSLLLGPSPSLDDYWREASYGAIDLEGSRVLDWRKLPKRSDDYRTADGGVRLDDLAADCMATARADISAHPLAALVFVFNLTLNLSAYAGPACVPTDDTPVCRTVVWLWRGPSERLAVWAHEMGHVFGLDHSTDTSGSAYTDFSDIMGNVDSCQCGESPSRSAQHPSAWQKRLLGWISPEREYLAPPDGTATIELRGLAEPGDDGYLLATVEDFGRVGYAYAVEARTLTGYDACLSRAGVFIHRIEPDGNPHPIQLVRHAGDQRASIAASAWPPGAVFRDDAAGVVVSVEARTATGFRVTLATGRSARAVTPEMPPEIPEMQSVVTLPDVTTLGLASGPRGAIAVVGGPDPDSGEFVIAFHTWRAGLGWQVAQTLAEAWTRGTFAPPSLVESDNGRQVLAVARNSVGVSGAYFGPSAVSSIWVTDRSPAAAWDDPVRLSDLTPWERAVTPVVAANGGSIAAAWIGNKLGDTRVLLARRETPGAWSRAVQISDAQRRAFRSAPALAVAANGDVRAIWIESGRAGNGVWSAFVALSERPQPAERVSELRGVRVANPRLAVDGQGDWHAVWTAYGLCPEGSVALASILAARRPRDGVWGPALTVAAQQDGGNEIAPVLALAPDGTVYAAWTAYDVGQPALYLAQRPAAGHWSAPRRIAYTRASDLEAPALAAGAQGPVLLAWLSGEYGNRHLNSIQLPLSR